jgi:tRNA1(Val) A37 N6-methylase TrmN6
MAESQPGLGGEARLDSLSVDEWLGGRLTLIQPRKGHRIGSDAVLLSAAAGSVEGPIVDVGAGVGAVGLAVASRSACATADLVEIDPELARLASGNAERNALTFRIRVLQVDVGDAQARRAAGLVDEAADCVVTNPPFFDPREVRVSPDPSRARSHAFSLRAKGDPPVVGWIRACLALLAPGGRLVMIHRPEALAQILTAAENRAGGLTLLPVHPRAGASAHRLLISAVKGSKAPLRIAPALVLHQTDGRLTAEADAIHRGEALIDWSA